LHIIFVNNKMTQGSGRRRIDGLLAELEASGNATLRAAIEAVTGQRKEQQQP
jgi:hypothetical protein